MRHIKKSQLLGVSFEAVPMATAVARCLELCHAPRASHTVITANASHLCMMRRDRELAQSCRAAHLTVADGMSVVWALRASGQPAPERVAGVLTVAIGAPSGSVWGKCCKNWAEIPPLRPNSTRIGR